MTIRNYLHAFARLARRIWHGLHRPAPTSPAPTRTFSDGVAQLIDELDRRKEQP